MPLATTLRSLSESNQSGLYEIFIFSHGFSEDMKRKIAGSLPQASFSIEWLPVDLSPFARFSTLRHISTTTYARLLIAKLLPEGIDRVLYLDGDILVLSDLGRIWEEDLEGAVLGAVLDERVTTHIKMQNEPWSLRGLPRVREYFNAGVLLIDLVQWRQEALGEKALEYLEQHPHTPYSDQDALNVACDGLWKKLDRRWNYFQIDLEKPLSDLSTAERPNIVHFHGWSKPWNASSLNCNAGFYDSFRSRTLFARTREERLRNIPAVLWSRLKKAVKRSAIVDFIWNQLRSSQSRGARGSRRMPA